MGLAGVGVGGVREVPSEGFFEGVPHGEAGADTASEVIDGGYEVAEPCGAVGECFGVGLGNELVSIHRWTASR